MTGLDSFRLIVMSLASQTGWRQNAIAFSAGVASILAFAPFHASPVLFLTLPVLALLSDPTPQLRSQNTHAQASGLAIFIHPMFSRDNARRGFAVGWWFGFGFHLAGLYWIGGAFLVQHEVFAWLLPFAITLMPAGLAVFHGAAIALLACISGSAIARVLVLILALSGTEWLRGHILTGFPWNILGYALAHPLIFLQTASVVGIYGLTAITLCVFCTPLLVVLKASRRGQPMAAMAPIGLLTIAPLLIMAAYGVHCLARPSPGTVENVKLRLVQPSINQRDKFDPSKRVEIFKRHLELSSRGLQSHARKGAPITHIIWPEAALAFLALRSPEALALIADALPDYVTLVAGTLRLEGELGANGQQQHKVFNSAMVVGGDGTVLSVYDKVHLVPFGEYLPLQEWMEAAGFEQITRVRGGFTAGVAPQPLTPLPGLADVRILICYEVIFPGEVVGGLKRPAVLINLTNDAWYGRSTGPFQHFHQSVVRAVEQGIPLIRVGNNGISGVVDGHGRIVSQMDLNAVGVIDVHLPKPLAQTLYSRLGDTMFAVFWLLLSCFICIKAWPGLR